MSYDNRYSLTINGETTKLVAFCPKCKTQKKGKFCPECGTRLEDLVVPITTEEIIDQLRTEDNDCGYLLDEDGSSYETGSGHTIEEEIQEFSKRYPTLIFQLDCDWDSGFGDPPSRYFYKNGAKQSAKISYNEPNFDE